MSKLGEKGSDAADGRSTRNNNILSAMFGVDNDLVPVLAGYRLEVGGAELQTVHTYLHLCRLRTL
jgi:hypothetical protein